MPPGTIAGPDTTTRGISARLGLGAQPLSDEESGSVTDPSLGSLKLLRPLVDLTKKRVRIWRAQRKAAREPSLMAARQMDTALRGEFANLQAEKTEESWWQGVLRSIGQAVIASDDLRAPAVQRWLQMEAVEDDIVAIAKALVTTAALDDEDAIRARLRRSYEAEVSDADASAADAIEVVSAVVAAGYMAATPPDQQGVVGHLQVIGDDVSQIRRTTAELARIKPGAATIIGDLLAERMGRELHGILTTRAFTPKDAVQRIQDLRERVESDGDLAGAPEAQKSRVRYWAAKLCAGDSDTLEVARAIRQQLREGGAEGPLVVIDALILANSGDFYGALRLVRDVDHPDARSVLLRLVAQSAGEAEALKQFADLDPASSPAYFTEMGWRAWPCIWRTLTDGKKQRVVCSLSKSRRSVAPLWR